jgi:hypothetical protein
MKSPGLISVAFALAASSASAQSIFDSSIRTGGLIASYDIAAPIGTKIRQLAVPFAVNVPFGSRANFDIAGAYASVNVDFDNGQPSEAISGLTDTQLRANFSLGQDFIVFTAGLNLPTGKSTVSEKELLAAGFIGNEFLAFPIPSMGTGFGGTGGIAIARPVGEWNFGFGASMRYSAEYEPYRFNYETVDDDGVVTDTVQESIRFQPGNEYRVRVGADHGFLGGRLAGGLTYSKFGEDNVGGGTVYSTGDRYIGEAGYSRTLRGVDYIVSAWNLFRGEGIRAGSRAPSENITNAAFSAGFDMGGVRIEPNVEMRMWYSEQHYLGKLALIGLRNRLSFAGLELYPSATYAIGTMTANDQSKPSLSGYRASLTGRFAR